MMAQKKLKVKPVSLCVAALMLFVVGKAQADGFIVIVPPPGPMPRPIRRIVPLAVRRHTVTVEIDGLVATTEVDQVFYNPNHMQLEGEYLFPLPEGASIKDFTLYINGEPVKAELLDADAARKTYEDIVRRMRDPALLEYSGRGLFRARIFPIPARGERRIILRYSETLSPDADLWGYRYPLNTEKFSSAPLDEVSVDVKCRTNRRIQAVYSTSHPSGKLEKNADGREFRYTWRDRNVKPDKDFVLHYITAQGTVSAAPVVHRSAGADGYFMLLVSVDEKRRNNKAIPKDIIFVTDTSGSMRGEKIEQAKKALRFCIQGLSDNDTFNVITFSTGVHPFYDKLVSAGDGYVRDAVERVRDIEATGGTNINEALETALKMMSERNGRPGYVVFLTDGRPTVGDTSVDGISGTVKKANGRKARIFAFGVGDNLNAKLLDRLSAENRGVKTYVGENENLELKLSSFFSKISPPALSDTRLRIEGIDAYDIFPKELPDLFYGQELAIYGRCRGNGRATVVIEGRRSGRMVAFERDAVFPAEAKAEAVPRLWASQKIAYLLEEIRLEGETQSMKDEVVRLAKKYGIITPYTSMLVLEDEKVEGRPRILREALRSAEASGEADAEAHFRRKTEEAKAGFDSTTGGNAVRASKAIDALKKSPTAPAARGDETARYLETAIRRFAEKTFYLVEGYWQDADFDPARMTTEEVKFLSREYFQLLKKHPEIGRYLALGEKVIVVVAGKAYRVVP